jgi:hypothetical protein
VGYLFISRFFYIFANIIADNKMIELEDKNKDIIANFKKGDLFKIAFNNFNSRIKIVGIFKSCALDVYGQGWHKINCYFLINLTNKKWYINGSCGCDTETRILKPTMEDYIKMTSILKANKTILNRKRLLTRGEDINFTNEYGESMF